MKLDILIKNGKVIDPTVPFGKVMDIGISKGRIVRNTTGAEAATVVDATGCLVTPGLIDCHTHVFEGCGVSSVDPDMIFLPNGVTAGIDGGTAGVSTYKLFSRSIIRNSFSTVKAYLHPSPTGLAGIKYFPEPVNPALFDIEAIKDCIAQHPDEIVALKLRISKNVVGELGLKPLEAVVKIGDEVGLPVAVHTTDPPADVDAVLGILRKGDVYAHSFNGRGYTLLNESGKLKPCVRKARERGVIFDTSDGISHFTFRVAQQALSEGFMPDCISTDEIDRSLYKAPVYSMPYIMSKYLAMGMAVEDIIRASTETPAKVFGMSGLGSLDDGAIADIAILELRDRNVLFTDNEGGTCKGTQLLVPQMTVKNGTIVYRQVDFI